MGGYGSGGHNKRNEDITEVVRIDSYKEHDRAMGVTDTQKVCAGFHEAIYFICPKCGRRARYLYERNERFLCRRCSHLSYPCQYLPVYNYAMTKIFEILLILDVDIDNFTHPLQILEFEPEIPDYKMTEQEFFEYTMELFKYKMMYIEDCKK